MKESRCKQGYADYLKGKYYGILKDFENKRPFEKLLDSLLVELTGALFDYDSININRLYALTASLRYVKYQYFRDVIIHVCMPLVDSIFGE